MHFSICPFFFSFSFLLLEVEGRKKGKSETANQMVCRDMGRTCWCAHTHPQKRETISFDLNAFTIWEWRGKCVQNDFAYSRGTPHIYSRRTATAAAKKKKKKQVKSEKKKKKRVHLVLRPWQHLVNSSADIYFKPKKIKIRTWQQNRFAPYLIVRLFSSRSNMFWLFSFGIHGHHLWCW